MTALGALVALDVARWAGAEVVGARWDGVDLPSLRFGPRCWDIVAMVAEAADPRTEVEFWDFWSAMVADCQAKNTAEFRRMLGEINDQDR